MNPPHILKRIQSTLQSIFHRPLSRSRRGISIVISLIIMSIIFLQMAGMARRNTESMELRKSYMNTRQGYWNARSGLAVALLSITHPQELQDMMDSGEVTFDPITKKYTMDLAKPVTPQNPNPTPSSASWVINNQSSDIEQSYNEKGATSVVGTSSKGDFHIFPFPGSGKLGGDKCDIEKMKNKNILKIDNPDFKKEMASLQGIDVTSQDFKPEQYLLPNNVDYLDYPCFWNTLEQGKTESIPLYTQSEKCPTDAFGDHVCNPANVGMTNLIVRIRTPCKSGGMICNASDRKTLIGTLDKSRVVLWDINAKCQELKGNPKSCYFTGWEDEEKKDKNLILSEESVIFGKELNDEKEMFKKEDKTTPLFTGLDMSKAFPDDLKNDPLILEKKAKPTLLNALTVVPPWSDYFKNLTRPKMNLSISAYLQDNSTKSETIQNLEYQILYQVDDTKLKSFGLTSFITNPIIIAEGRYANFRTKLQTALNRPGGAFSYVYIGQ